MPRGLVADEESPLRLWDPSSATDEDDTDSKAGICINSEVPHMVESAYFSGHVLFYVEGLPSSPARLFKGHKRRSHLIVKVPHRPLLKLHRTCAAHMPSRHTLHLSRYSQGLHASSQRAACVSYWYIRSGQIQATSVV